MCSFVPKVRSPRWSPSQEGYGPIPEDLVHDQQGLPRQPSGDARDWAGADARGASPKALDPADRRARRWRSPSASLLSREHAKPATGLLPSPGALQKAAVGGAGTGGLPTSQGSQLSPGSGPWRQLKLSRRSSVTLFPSKSASWTASSVPRISKPSVRGGHGVLGILACLNVPTVTEAETQRHEASALGLPNRAEREAPASLPPRLSGEGRCGYLS